MLLIAELHYSPTAPLLGALAKLPKATVSFVMSVCLSVRLYACANAAPTGRIFMNANGTYKLQRNTCKKSYVGQTGRSLTTSHREHICYIKTNNPLSAYAKHILNNRHEYGKPEHTTPTTMSKRKTHELLGNIIHTATTTTVTDRRTEI